MAAEYWGPGNLGGGSDGAGNEKSIIIVSAPKETIRISAGYNGKTRRGVFRDGSWMIKGLDFGPEVSWTVTASKESESVSEEVHMPRLSVEYLTMNYWHGELYDNGNEYAEFTGGWIGEQWWGGIGKGTYAKENGSMVLTCARSVKSSIRARTVNAIDLSKFQSLKIHLDHQNISETLPPSDWRLKLAVLTTLEGTRDDAAFLKLDGLAPGDYSIDVSQITGRHWIALSLVNFGSVSAYEAKASKIWLE